MCFVLFYSLTQAHLLLGYFRGLNNKPVEVNPVRDDELPNVTLQLPIFNEQYVVERLLAAAARLNYPAGKLEIQVLDDSTDGTSEMIADEIKKYPGTLFFHLRRSNREGFKAGALKAGLKSATGEFVAVFDADFVPDPDFIRKTLPYFQDPRVGMVQTRWTHLNQDFSLLTRLQAFALDTHFSVEQIGRNVLGAFINFNGTGGIWRKSCILDAGNWESDTLTEDLDLSYRAQQRGWKFVYRGDIASPAELPPVMSAIKSQQFRWTKGGAECAAKHLGRVWEAPLPWRVRLHATAHLLNSVVFVAVFLVALSSIPLWWAFHREMLSSRIFEGAAVFLLGFVVIAAVYFVGNVGVQKDSKQSSLRFIWELPLFLSVSMGLCIHNGLAVWEGLSGRKSPFIRTPKYNLKERKLNWKDNFYHSRSVPLGTYFELLMAGVFSAIVGASLYVQAYEMLLFHSMLAVGFWIVGLTSVFGSRWSSTGR
nr:cellulose synthase family protein [Lunatimonas lonarensis]